MSTTSNHALSNTTDHFFKGSGQFTDPRLAVPPAATHKIRACLVNVYPTATATDRIDTQLLYGEQVTVTGSEEGRYHIISHTDGYQGWIQANGTLSPIEKACTQPTHFLNIPLSHLYKAPDLKTADPIPLPMGAQISITEDAQVKGFLKTTENLYVYAAHCQPLAEIGDVNHSPLDWAKKFLGVPYLWGGRSAMGIDCSALMQIAFAACGIPLHRDSDLQFKYHGQTVQTPQAGDLAFFPGHVGLMVDADHLLHANATHMKVTTDPLQEVISWLENEGQTTPFLGFRRIAL